MVVFRKVLALQPRSGLKMIKLISISLYFVVYKLNDLFYRNFFNWSIAYADRKINEKKYILGAYILNNLFTINQLFWVKLKRELEGFLIHYI